MHETPTLCGAAVHKEHMHYISTSPENPLNTAMQFVDHNVQIQDYVFD